MSRSIPFPAPIPSVAFASFEVVTKAGAPICTFDNQTAAEAYAEHMADAFPGLRVVKFTRRETRQVVWPATLRLVPADAAQAADIRGAKP